MKTVSALDVARYILNKQGEMTAMKLQKLVYYSQAWSLVWDDAPLFKEKIEAWAGGPVIRELYLKHKGKFTVTKSSFSGGDSRKLNNNQKETIDVILDHYGDKSGQWLSDLTHSERPWVYARRGIPPFERGSKEISLESMQEFYSFLSQESG